MSFLRHIRACTNYDPAKFVPFYIGPQQVGWVVHDVRELLIHSKHPFLNSDRSFALDPEITAYEARTEALAKASKLLSQHKNMHLRGEMFPVMVDWNQKPLAEIDRAGLPWFGIRGFGIHANGFVRKKDGLYMWIAERSQTHAVDPGKLDNFIGGGMSLGYSPEETLVKEAWEEAGIPKEMALAAHPEGALHYKVELMGGLRNDTLFIYDFELPEDFTPRNTDGEVSAFKLMPFMDVATLIYTTDRFKFNCNLVIIDFLLRHRLIDPAHNEHAELVAALMKIRTSPSV